MEAVIRMVFRYTDFSKLVSCCVFAMTGKPTRVMIGLVTP